MAFDFNDLDYQKVIDERTASTKRKRLNLNKLEKKILELEKIPLNRKFQEVVYEEVLFYILKDKSLYEENEAAQEKLLVLSTNIEDMNNDELMSALKCLFDVVNPLGLGQIKNSSWTYRDLLGLAISKRLDLLF